MAQQEDKKQNSQAPQKGQMDQKSSSWDQNSKLNKDQSAKTTQRSTDQFKKDSDADLDE